WLSGEVKVFPSQLRTKEDISRLCGEVSLTSIVYFDLFLAEPCSTTERAIMQAYRVVCHCLHIEATTSKFLHHYSTSKVDFLKFERWLNKFNVWAREDMPASDQTYLNDLNKLPKSLSYHDVVKVVFLAPLPKIWQVSIDLDK
ncbi:hypothetical protein CR513_06871, partial [Mucuna pruriens]